MTRGVRLEDLPGPMQAQVREQAGVREPRRKDRRGAERVATDGVCVACGTRWKSVSKWERHSDETGHRRLELIAQHPNPARSEQ